MTLYHVSPADRQAAIAAEGLDPEKGLDTPGWIWFYTDEARALAHAGHRSAVWVLDDPETAGVRLDWRTPWDGAACRTADHVPPDALRLHREGVLR